MKIAVDARTLGSRPSGVGMYLNDFLKVLMKYREFELYCFPMWQKASTSDILWKREFP